MLGGFPVGPFSGQSEYLIDFWLKARFRPYPKTRHMELPQVMQVKKSRTAPGATELNYSLQ